jgi:hypothetical protein
MLAEAPSRLQESLASFLSHWAAISHQVGGPSLEGTFAFLRGAVQLEELACMPDVSHRD